MVHWLHEASCSTAYNLRNLGMMRIEAQMRSPRGKLRGSVLLCSLLVAGLALAGCTPFLSDPIKVEPGNADVISTVHRDGDVMVIDVTSRSGIGRLRATLGEKVAPPELALRLRLNGLEELRFSYPGAEVAVSVSSSDGRVRAEAQPAGAAAFAEIGPDSPYWMEVQVFDSSGAPTTAIPTGGGWFDVAVPADFLDGEHRTFTAGWVDFYR
jgi:hypothetical protein